MSVRRLLVFRQGSLGDTAVAVPALRLLAERFPEAERRVLTNVPVSGLAPPLAAVLEGTGLIHGTFEYPAGMRDWRTTLALLRHLRAWGPELTVYLNSGVQPLRVRRDALFLRLIGAPMLGVPRTRDLAKHRRLKPDLWESEGARLARCLASLGDAGADDPARYDLALGARERAAAARVLAPLGNRPVLAISQGGKFQSKDWGDDNWHGLMVRLADRHAKLAIVAIGAGTEATRAEALLSAWPGRTLNLCGVVDVRVAAAVLERARIYVGHDAGPMHLAAAAGTPCVAIFSARNKPGVWFPQGAQHRVFYRMTDCFDCRLTTCIGEGKRCILPISPGEVAAAVDAVLAAAPGGGT
jgi:ADP-heptose:LPS heptosyltransferase